MTTQVSPDYSKMSLKELTDPIIKNGGSIKEKDVTTTTHLHNAAKTGRLREINPKFITSVSFSTQNSQGETPLHIIARSGNYAQLPPKVLSNPEFFKRADLQGNSIFHTILENITNPNNIPPEIFAQLNDPKNLTQPNGQLTTSAHQMAKIGVLNRLPPETFENNPEILLASDENGETPLHRAALHGTFYLIPPTALTQKNLEAREEEGKTIFHTLSLSGTFEGIPTKFITQENLIQTQDYSENCPLDYLFKRLRKNLIGTRYHQLEIPFKILDQYQPLNPDKKENLQKTLSFYPEYTAKFKRFKRTQKFLRRSLEKELIQR